MRKERQYRLKNLTVGILISSAFAAALLFAFFMIRSINHRMNESAASNLLNTTRVIQGNVENAIGKDFASLKMIGEIYKDGMCADGEKIAVLGEAMGFERIGIADAQGNGVEELSDGFQPSGLICYSQWTPGETGYSDAYLGDSGRLQTTLWVPVYENAKYRGTIFGEVILTRYYSADVFTFYEGAGRTYLFDGSNGGWILRSMGTDGASKRQDDIYALLLHSGNTSDEVYSFRRAIEAGQTGTAVFDFNGEISYICFMPLPSSPDWYLATVIARDTLLKEAAQVQRMIRVLLLACSAALLSLAVAAAAWQIRRNRSREAEYRDLLFSNISANIDSAFLIYEPGSGRAAFVSDNVKRLLELDREWMEADAGNLFDWCGIEQTDSGRVSFLEGTLEGPVSFEVSVENEMGVKSRYIRLELIPADMGQYIAVVTDITKDKDVQNSLLEAMQRAEAASRAKNDFLSAMSHDIRTPMNGIVGMTAIAAMHLDDKCRVKDCLGKISEASLHLLNLINEVLDMSRVESGKMELSEEPFHLPEILKETLNMNYPGISKKGHTVKAHIHSMEHEKVIGDPVRLRRITDNLISNAIKYTPEGGTIVLNLKEKPSVIQGYGCYEITVQDNGIGMSADFQKKLFQPFEREEDVRLSKIQGTGLGMSIVKNIVTLMMGDIEVESEKNKGTVFRVTINLKLDEQENGTDKKLKHLPVLVVDDDVDTCETVSQMLCDIGMAGEWVDNGAQAVMKTLERHRRQEDYLAVLLDWKMPGMDGIETARQIREKVGSGVPIIILTAYDWEEIEEEARTAGVDAFLEKPVYKAKLQQKMVLVSEGRGRTGEQGKNIEQEKSAYSGIPAGRRVLMAEDNELNKEIAMELLKMMDIEVDCAENGEQAVRLFADSGPGTYDLILMDIQMPVMNGYEAAKEIRKMKRPDSGTVPIVAMTADAFAKDVRSAHAAGMNAHISKPISVEYLNQVLKRFLSGQGEGNENEGVSKQ